MPKKKDFDKVESYVVKVLEDIKYTRDDDMLLYYHTCRLMSLVKYGRFNEPTFWEMAATHKQLGFPSYETVSRVRRKLVSGSRPDLQSDERKRIRQEQIPDYVEYAISENTSF